MDYEKKYKEANDKVVARFGTNVAKEIFTDLYESDDENVRKWLLNLVQSLPDKGLIFSSYDDIEKAKVLAWIEKQGKQDFRERYKKIAQSEWFKQTHDGMSIGDVQEIEPIDINPSEFDLRLSNFELEE